MKILVAEDSDIVRKGYVRMLEANSHTVTAVENGAKAAHLIEKEGQRFDLIITDFNMPVLNGLGVIRRIRAVVSDAQIFLTSGTPDENVFKEALELGATKAFPKEKLVAELKAAKIIS